MKPCQAFLGAKLHDPKDPGADLQPMMVEVVSTLFELMERYEESWIGVAGSEAIPLFGFSHAVGLERACQGGAPRVDFSGRRRRIWRASGEFSLRAVDHLASRRGRDAAGRHASGRRLGPGSLRGRCGLAGSAPSAETLIKALVPFISQGRFVHR